MELEHDGLCNSTESGQGQGWPGAGQAGKSLYTESGRAHLCKSAKSGQGQGRPVPRYRAANWTRKGMAGCRAGRQECHVQKYGCNAPSAGQR
eukprot:1157869-Pelagomonas_calceolata.AAC.10